MSRTAHLRSALPLRPVVLGAVAVACSLLVGSLADAARENDGWAEADGPTARWFAAHRTAGLDAAALHVGAVTAPLVVAALCAVAIVVLWLRGARRPAILLAAAIGLALVTTTVVKVVVGRPRPLAPLNLTPESEPSFPSGHVLAVAAVALMAVVLLWPIASRAMRAASVAVGAALVALVCADRLLIDAHWLTDVVASLVLAVLIVCAVLAVDALVRGSRLRRVD